MVCAILGARRSRDWIRVGHLLGNLEKKLVTEVRYDRPIWAGRIPRQKIAELYAKDAQGIRDEELINEVGIGLLVRYERLGCEKARGMIVRNFEQQACD